MEPPTRPLRAKAEEWRTRLAKADSNSFPSATPPKATPPSTYVSDHTTTSSVALDPGPKSQSLGSVPPYTTLGQLSYAPATQTTVVTTTTTTTTAFPPLILKAPRQLSELDPKLYPLASSPTPSSIKRFCFNLGGRPTYFREAENVTETLEKVSSKFGFELHFEKRKAIVSRNLQRSASATSIGTY